MQAPTPPPLARMHATHSPSPQPPPPQCLYDWRHPTLPHRQGVQKVRWPPPFPRHPHLLTLPVCVGRPTRVAAPVGPPCLRALPRPPSSPACRGARRDSAPPVPSAWAMPTVLLGLCALPCTHALPLCAHAGGCRRDCGGCTQGEGPCARGGGMTGGDAREGEGSTQGEGEGVQASKRAAHEQKGARTLSAPPAPSRLT